MSKHQARIHWARAAGEPFVDSRYSRAHEWRFDGGAIVPASSSPHSVRIPFSKAENVDPEEALVAALSSCHMLTFLYLAAKDGFVVDEYEDAAYGELSKNERGRLAITHVTLAPDITFSGLKAPAADDVERLHHAAHEECYVANSVTATVVVNGTWRCVR